MRDQGKKKRESTVLYSCGTDDYESVIGFASKLFTHAKAGISIAVSQLMFKLSDVSVLAYAATNDTALARPRSPTVEFIFFSVHLTKVC